MTSRLKLPLVTWKFSSGYNFCRVKKKKKPALRLLLPATTELGRTPEQPGTYTWGGGRRGCVCCGRGIGLYFPDKQLCVEQDRASVPLVRSVRLRPAMLVTSLSIIKCARCHKLDTKAWVLLCTPLSLPTPPPWLEEPQISGRKSLEGKQKSKQTVPVLIGKKFIHWSALSQALKSSPGCTPLKTSLAVVGCSSRVSRSPACLPPRTLPW